MTDYHFRCDESIKAKGRESELLVPYPSGVLEGVPFEQVGFRHLNKNWIEKSKPCTKVYVMIGEYDDGDPPRFMARDLRMRVVKDGGTSCEPYVVMFQPPQSPPPPDPPKTPPPPEPSEPPKEG